MCPGKHIKLTTKAVNSLSEARESCKNACDADNECKFAWLNYAPEYTAIAWCKHFDGTCSTSAQNAVLGNHVYVKSTYEDSNYIFVMIKRKKTIISTTI